MSLPSISHLSIHLIFLLRLVIDKETGKPKGYGFCEYKDEETALSARRNLKGYEINGRQLRVDFAENDKNSDRNREQVRHLNVLGRFFYITPYQKLLYSVFISIPFLNLLSLE